MWEFHFGGEQEGKEVLCLPFDRAWCFAIGGESLQRKELSHHEHPRENPQCPGLQGEWVSLHFPRNCLEPGGVYLCSVILHEFLGVP